MLEGYVCSNDEVHVFLLGREDNGINKSMVRCSTNDDGRIYGYCDDASSRDNAMV